MLEKAFRNGESVSSDYAKALDDAISKVHGVECNVHGTYTISAQRSYKANLSWVLSAWLLYVHCNSRFSTAEQVVRLPR